MDLNEIQQQLQLKKKRRLIALALFIIFVSCFVFIVSLGLNKAAVSIQQLNIVSAQRGDFQVKLIANGQFKPKSPKFISSEQSGLITDIFVNPGEFVQAGTKLMQLKNEKLMLEHNSLINKIQDLKLKFELKQERLKLDEIRQKSELEKLRGEVSVTEANYAAQKQLAEKGIVSDLDILATKVRLSNYKKQVELGQQTLITLSNLIEKELALSQLQLLQLNSELASIEQNISELIITAQESGRLQSIRTKIGEKIEEGKIVAEINKPNNLHFVAQIPEREAEQITRTNTAKIKVFDNWIDGKVEQINPNVTDGLIDVYVSFPAEQINLKQGQSAKAEIITQILPDTIYIERWNDYKPFSQGSVWLLDENLGQVNKVDVSFGSASSNFIVIEEGLDGGEKLVMSEQMVHWKGNSLSVDI